MKRFIFFIISFFLLVVSNSVLAFSYSSITNKDATNVKINTATLNANIDSLVDANGVEYWFEYGQINGNFTYKTTNVKSTATGAIYQNITSLGAGTTYYYRVCSKDSVSVSCYNTKSFTTYNNPSLSISNAVNVADTTARFVGSITGLGGTGATVSYWFEYGIGSSYSGKLSTTTKTTTSLDAVYFDLTNLKSSTTYYYKICAKNEFSSSNVCSSDSYFTTNATVVPQNDSTNAPVVETVKYEFTSSNSVDLTGNIKSMGKFTSLNYYFDYGQNMSYGSSLNDSKNLSTATSFKSEVKNLQFGLTYYFRACVRDTVNVNNIYCGEPSFFTVYDYKGSNFKISILPPTSIKDTSIKLNATIDGFNGFDNVTAYFNIIDSNGLISQTSKINVPYTLRNFSIFAENLKSGATYKYTACVFTASRVYCDPVGSNFTLLKPAIIDSTGSSVNSDKVTLISKISDVGVIADYFPNVNTWFTYTTDSTFKTSLVDTTKKIYSVSDVVEYVSGLKKDTKYYYKFCIDNSLGAVCSDVKDFTITFAATPSAPTDNTTIPTTPVTPTMPVSDLTDPDIIPFSLYKPNSNTIEIGYKALSFGGDITSSVYANWGDSSSVANKTDDIKISDEGYYGTLKISSLVENKKYYYKLCIKNTTKTTCTNLFNFKLFKDKGSDMFAKIPAYLKKANLNVKFAENFRGKILVQKADNSYLWYVNPTNLRRYYLYNYQNAYNALKILNTTLSDVEFSKFLNNRATSKYAGKIISKASNVNKLYYVDSKDLRMWYFVDSNEFAFVASKVAVNISQNDLLKIDYIDLSDTVYSVDKYDTDGDAIYDDIELNIYKTNPYESDTNGNGYTDSAEIKKGYNPVIDGLKLY